MAIATVFKTLREGRFEMEAAEIKLVQRAIERPRSYSGPGHIKQGTDGELALKCYATAELLDGMSFLHGGPASGELYKDEDYFDCSIIDHNGDTWHTDPLLISASYSLPTKAAVINASLRTLVRHLDSRAASWTLTLEFRDQRGEDWRALVGNNTVRIGGSASLIDFEITHSDDVATVIIKSSTEPPHEFESRLTQALSFVIGKELHSATVDNVTPTDRTVTIRPTRKETLRRSSFPPINPSLPSLKRSVLQLLERYLEHILGVDTADEALWHPISIYVALSRKASGQSLDLWAIGLSVAVEGVAKLIPFSRPSAKTDLAALNYKITKYLEIEQYPVEIVNRISGMLSGMGSISAKDRMHSLVSSGGVQKSDIAAWSTLRNSAVHTKHVTLIDLNDENIQEKLDLIFRSQRLLHNIVFHLISYNGSFTDYGSRDFPTALYPYPSTSVADGVPDTTSLAPE